MKLLNMMCINCQMTGHIDIRYMTTRKGEPGHPGWNLEYHCESYTGGCNFYRLVPMYYTESIVEV